MTKWRFVPVEPTPEMQAVAQSVAGFAGINIYLEDAREIYSAMLEVAPQREPLSDERIFDLLKQVDPHAVRLPLGFKQFAIAIECEIFGGGDE